MSTKRARMTPAGSGSGKLPPAPGATKPKAAGDAPQEFSKRTLVEHQKQLRDQRMLLAKLRKENIALREELQMESQHTQVGSGMGSAQLLEVSKLSEEAELYVAKIEQERKRAQELDKRCRDFSKRILEGKSASDSLEMFLKDAKHINQTLENRLHAGKTKFGEFLTENKNLRQNINELRFEKKHFRHTLSKLENELARVNDDIERVVTDSKALFEERLQVLQKITEMKNVSDDEQKNYMAQCRELNAVLQAFEQSEKHMHAGKLMYDLQDHMGSMSTDQEEELQRKIVRGKWQLAKEKALGDVLRDQAVTFEDALTRIQEATGYSHMEHFVSHFIQIEEHNFHRFKYLNSLNQDTEKAAEELNSLKSQLITLGEAGNTSDKNWEHIQEQAGERVGKLETQAAEMEQKTISMEAQVEEMLGAMERMTQKLGCKLGADEAMPHESTEVSEINLLKWLGSVEAKTSELLALQAAQQAKIRTDEFDRPHVSLGPKKSGKTLIQSIEAVPPTTVLATRAVIRPPTIKEDEIGKDDEPDLDMPLGEQILRQKVDQTAESLVQQNLTWLEPRARSAGPKDKKLAAPSGGPGVDQAARTPQAFGAGKKSILSRANDFDDKKSGGSSSVKSGK